MPESWLGRPRPLIVGAVVAIAVTVIACRDGGTDATPTPTPTPPPPTPTATPPPVDPPVAGGYRLTQTLSAAAFGQMLGFYVIPGAGNQAVIVTQGGKVYRLSLSGGAPDLYGDLSARVIDFNAENEGGLLGLAFSPSFQSDHRVYLYFTSNDCGSGAGRCDVLARYTVSANTINTGSEVVLVEVDDPYPNHNGGQILFGPDGYLYVALGDGGDGGDPEETGQDRTDLPGSILRINVSGSGYTVPSDNPFPGNPVFAFGFRNPWRFSFDRQTGTMWVGDVGQDQWEEVERVVKGGNYGWDCYEGFASYEPAGCPSSGLIMPRAVYSSGSESEECSVTGGYVYRGPSMPELDGWYVYGDFCSGKIWAVNTVGSAAPVLLADTGLPIASFGEMPNGELLVLTFANAVYKLARS
ncbi:MAG: PQQ-dependent sugar dehydrogenase [Dehalococcoidia bacterium]|nr:PQQ-dependent sugar dehydrogenase [Dehalococcoidia bacterium]